MWAKRYDSKVLMKLRGHKRSWVGGNRGHYVFRIRGFRRPDNAKHPIYIELHSSISRGNIGMRAGGEDEGVRCATSLTLNDEDARHLVAALLGAMNEA